MNNYKKNNYKNNYNKKPKTTLEKLLEEEARKDAERKQKNKSYTKGQKLIDDTSVYANGEIAEVLVAQLFRNKGWEVTDMSKNEIAQKLDIDLAIKKNNLFHRLEVKYDSYTAKTNTICLELRNITWNKKCWFYTSGADKLVVVPKGKEYIMYIFDFEELRKHEHLFEIKRQRDSASNCWFEVGIVNISDLQLAGVTVGTFMLPSISDCEINGYSYDYVQDVIKLQSCFDDEEITARFGYEIPEYLKRGEM